MIACLILAAGCKKEATEKPEPAIKKLLARTDIVIVKHFFAKAGVTEDKNPKLPEVYPGMVSIEPIWVYEPGKQKEGDRGAQITVMESWLPPSAGGSHDIREATAFLDLDELKDMDGALGYFSQSDSPWRSSAKGDTVEVHFNSKDNFQVSAFKSEEDGKESLAFEAEGINAFIPIEKLPEFKEKLEAAIHLLDSKMN